jgi:hypothetical protein
MRSLIRINHEASTAAVDPVMSALRSFGLLDALSSMLAAPCETNIVTLGAKLQAPRPSAPPHYKPS